MNTPTLVSTAVIPTSQPRGMSGNANSGIKAGLFAVLLFSLTAPATKLALGHYSAETITSARGLIAGICALFIVMNTSPRKTWTLPNGNQLVWLLIAGAGVVIGFPYTLTLAMQDMTASSMGIVLAGLPLFTTITASLLFGERHSKGFWISTLIGCGILLLFFQQGLMNSIWSLQTIAMLIFQLALGGIGYAAGAHVAKSLGGWRTICWTLLIYLPISAVAFGYSLGGDFNADLSLIKNDAGILSATLAVLYLAFFSQWLGFKFWYQALADAGTGRISQIQLLQPFLTLGFSIIVFGEVFEVRYLLFAGLIAATVLAALRFKQPE